MTHPNRVRLSKLSLGLLVALAAAPAFAQSTSAGVGGQVMGADGQPVSGAEVTITHVESGTVSRAVTDASGRYVARGLRVGGPYTITINKAGAGSDTEQNIYLNLNQVSTVDATLNNATTTLGTVTVVASALSDVFSSANKGVGTSVSGRQLETAVSGNRSLDDIARLDPRITVTDQNDGSISVAGQNNRYNNISVDGLSVSDPFGASFSNGIGFSGSPISPDTIAAYDIKITDYDVTSDSVGANINAVTKSGTNEFHGSVYYALTDASSMVGDRGGNDYDSFNTNKTLGATFGGPIIKDKLFFFLSYEDQKINGIKGVGSDAVSTGKLTSQQVGDVATALEKIGMKPGAYGNGPATLQDKRTLAKVDWNITDNQRASFTFQRTEESKPTPYSAYVKDSSAILPSNWYTSAIKSDNYSVQLFSDWTDNFSTELKIGYQKYSKVDGAAIDQPEVFACFAVSCGTNAPGSIASNIPWVVAGEDRFRHENSVASKRFTGTLSGTYYAGDHAIKGGVDFLSNEIANVFGQLLHGSYGFSDKNGNGTPADEIAAGNYSTFVKNFLPDGVSLADSAGTWKYTQISPFLQDTWQVNDNLSIVYGVRVDIPKADHAPPVAVESSTNTAPGATAGAPVWESRFGYASNTTLGSRNKVIEPRFAFNYSFNTERKMQLRGGAGLFQTIPPYVWLTNPYTNNGVVSSKQYSYTPASGVIPTDFSANPNAQPGPTSALAGVCAPGATCQIDVLDPDFKLPGAWKFSLGFDAELPWGLTGSIDYQRIQHKNAIAYQAPNIGKPNGMLPDGRNAYWQTYPNPSTSQVGNGTNNGAYTELNTRSTVLTNTNQGGSDSLTFSLSKAMSNGFSGNASITQTRSTEVNPGTSAQAYSNFNYAARVEPNELREATSRFEVPLTLKASLNWEHAFFGDNKTSVNLYYNGHNGQPYSWIFGNDVNGDSLSNDDLAYIPQVNDSKVGRYVTNISTTRTPNYVAASAAQIQTFQEFISSNAYLNSRRGQIAERNASQQPWINQFDLGVQQELPGFFNGHKFVVRLDVYNFGNLLNKKWGEQDTLGFFGTRRLANVSDVINGKYVYDLTNPPQNPGVYDTYINPQRVVSRWQALLTVKYTF
ncbi:MAG: TonB-dependent receptor [Thermomonas sp.]